MTEETFWIDPKDLGRLGIEIPGKVVTEDAERKLSAALEKYGAKAIFKRQEELTFDHYKESPMVRVTITYFKSNVPDGWPERLLVN